MHQCGGLCLFAACCWIKSTTVVLVWKYYNMTRCKDLYTLKQLQCAQALLANIFLWIHCWSMVEGTDNLVSRFVHGPHCPCPVISLVRYSRSYWSFHHRWYPVLQITCKLPCTWVSCPIQLRWSSDRCMHAYVTLQVLNGAHHTDAAIRI